MKDSSQHTAVGDIARAQATDETDSKHREMEKQGRSEKQISQEEGPHFSSSVP